MNKDSFIYLPLIAVFIIPCVAMAQTDTIVPFKNIHDKYNADQHLAIKIKKQAFRKAPVDLYLDTTVFHQTKKDIYWRKEF